MNAFQTSFNPVLSLRERLKRVQRLELYYDDLHSTSMLMRRCEISDADIPEPCLFLFAVPVRQEETALRVDEKFVKFTLESLMLQMKLAGNRFDCGVQLFGKLSGAGNIVGWYFESITNLLVDDF